VWHHHLVPHIDEPALVSYVAEHSSSVALAVYEASDPAAARAALRDAAAQISQIRHPDEPDDALANRCDVRDEDGVPVLYLDMKDETRYAALVVRIVLDRLSGTGVDGRLEPQRRREAAFEYDANADRYGGMRPLAELDDRCLPPGFPLDFPVPDEATLVLAERYQDGSAEHAAWRRSTGPFTGYLQRLRKYGCTFGAVPRVLTAGNPLGGTAQYTLWRAGAGGRVTLYQFEPRSARSPVYWYVSVVWQPQAEPPATPVEPEEADTRPVPFGAAAARELAEFLVPAPLVAGYEAVIALANTAHVLDRLVSAPSDRADPRAKAVVAATRLAPVLGRLQPEQLTMVRHVCLTMVANLLASGRRPRSAGLMMVPDQDGHLYAAEVRERAQGVVPGDLLPVFETGVSLVQGAKLVADALSAIGSAPVRPPAHRYAWIFTDLDPHQLATARDACWQILEA